MAITLFKREKVDISFLAIEKVNLLYNLFTTILIIIFYNKLREPQEMLLDRFFIVLMTFAFIYFYTKLPSRASRFVRLVGQLALLSYWYPDTFEFNRIFPNLDHIFAQLDIDIFGCQPALLFDSKFGNYWTREFFNLGYFAYYPMIFTIILYYFFIKPTESERCTFILVSSFYLFYIIYIFVPVAGPQFYFPAIDPQLISCGPYPELGNFFHIHPYLIPAQGEEGGIFSYLVRAAQESGERPTAAFPSSHIGISTVIMLLALRAKKELFSSMLPLYGLLCCATVYIKAHYLIDAIAGIISGLAFYLFTAWIFDRWMSNSKE